MVAMALSNFKDRLSVLEKQLRKREQTKNNKDADEAFKEILNEAHKLIAEDSRRRAEQRAEQEAEKTHPLETPQPITTPVEPVTEAAESLDDFETWLGGVQDEDEN